MGGPEGSITGLHIDTHRLPFWIAVAGEPSRPLKRWRIFSHQDREVMRYGRSTGSNNFHFDFDPWLPNYWSFPGLRATSVYEFDMWSGDILYIPGGSPHSVRNLADNLGVSMNYMDLKALPEFAKRCNPQSPLCPLIQGKGEWVIHALEERRNLEKPMLYYEFAGVRDHADFCEVHAAAADAHEGGRPAGFNDYCPASI